MAEHVLQLAWRRLAWCLAPRRSVLSCLVLFCSLEFSGGDGMAAKQQKRTHFW